MTDGKRLRDFAESMAAADSESLFHGTVFLDGLDGALIGFADAADLHQVAVYSLRAMREVLGQGEVAFEDIDARIDHNIRVHHELGDVILVDDTYDFTDPDGIPLPQ